MTKNIYSTGDEGTGGKYRLMDYEWGNFGVEEEGRSLNFSRRKREPETGTTREMG